MYNLLLNKDQYLLVRPYPSLRMLFTSSSLEIPDILQSSFFSRIGGEPTVPTRRITWGFHGWTKCDSVCAVAQFI